VTDVRELLLLVEDEPQMRRFLRASLAAHGFRLLEATTVREGLSLAASHNPEVVLLDLVLPDGDGIELARQLREWSAVPIIVLSARGQEADKVLALDSGADDYVTKPFGIEELLARIRVALRHRRQLAGGEAGGSVIEVGNLRVDMARRRVERDGEEVHLTPTEYRLLTLLAQNLGKVLTHQHILREVWGPSYASQTHYVRVHMAELRKKVEADPARPKLLVTEPGVGYRLRETPRCE
jgi:two-component system KDP operon response regulator KdpE